jgi:hypothetical protein
MGETPGVNGAAIGQLRQQLQGLIDADLILPEDGQWLMATLDGALDGLTGANEPATRAGIEAFVGRIRSLIAAGVLAAGDGHPPIEQATAIAASLPYAGRTDSELRRRPGEAAITAVSRGKFIPRRRGLRAARPGTERNRER